MYVCVYVCVLCDVTLSEKMNGIYNLVGNDFNDWTFSKKYKRK